MEAADKELSDLAWRDVQKYQCELREEARKSLAFRLADSRRQQQLAIEEHRLHLDKLHEEFAIRHVEWKDVNAIKEKEAEKKRRMSVALRMDSWKCQRLAEEKLAAKKALIAQESARLDEEDWEALKRAKELLKMEETLKFKTTRFFN